MSGHALSSRALGASRRGASSATRAAAATGAAARGAAFGAVAVALLAAAIAAQNLHLLGAFGDAVAGVALIGLAMALVHGVLRGAAWLICRLAEKPPRLVGALRDPLPAASLTVILVLLFGREDGPLSFLGALVAFEILIGLGALCGMVAGAGLMLTRTTPRSPGATATGAALLSVAILLGAVSAGWAILPGMGDIRVAESPEAVAVIGALDLPDPSAPGPHPVARASYGSGMPAIRPEYAAAATWRTDPIDASGALDRPDGPATMYADAVWGFDTDALPVNGMAWYAADATEAMPVVLIVHGNHAARDFSDLGYAYLGEHLASRGMFAVSVDQNFLNGDAMYDYAGAEIGVRAWLLLQHLEVLRGWNADASHPLFGLLDLGRVALIGHSRGGEAAAMASMVEDGARTIHGMPEAPRGFGIGAVIGIAPSDGMAGGDPVAPRQVDYLVIQGAHDGDLPAFSGLRTYHRAEPTGPDGMKAAVYVGRANHGRFSSVWDDADAGPLYSWLLDRGSLLTMAEQQRVAKAVIGAFLARSLLGQREYDAFFHDPRAGRAWLPADVVQTHWQGAARTELGATEDLEAADLRAAGFSASATADPMLRDGTLQEDRALRLSWASPAVLAIPITPDEADAIEPGGLLTLSLGTRGAEVPEPTIVLRDRSGSSARIAMREVSPVRPVIPVQLWKLDGIAERYLPGEAIRWPAEHFLQTHAIDLAMFAATNPQLNLSDLASVTLEFTGDGEAFVDDIGFEPWR